ncbi:MAG: DEAD/DEAH box helicase, partial [Phycisphaerales bacterium]|nr:DEAD/DEAH box helicase [Phycisphaerales bacterium]
MSFAELKLSAPLCDALRRANYNHPTAIQAQAIPPALEGRDLIGIARTGTGKTAAYVLPMADHLASVAASRSRGDSRRGRRVRALVLCPTRELALQVADEAERITSGSRVRVLCVHGKVSLGPQATALAAGVDLLIATPGRVIELIEADAVDLEGIRQVVLDEADRMLDMGFEPQVRAILERVPA